MNLAKEPNARPIGEFKHLGFGIGPLEISRVTDSGDKDWIQWTAPVVNDLHFLLDSIRHKAIVDENAKHHVITVPLVQHFVPDFGKLDGRPEFLGLGHHQIWKNPAGFPASNSSMELLWML